MNNNSTPNRFNEMIKKGKELAEIQSVSWVVVGGDDGMLPDKIMIVLEDVNGKKWEMPVHPPVDEFRKKLINEEEVILNVVCSHHHLNMSGLWNGYNADISQFINALRKKYPYTLTVFVNEKECRMSDWIVPIYRN